MITAIKGEGNSLHVIFVLHLYLYLCSYFYSHLYFCFLIWSQREADSLHARCRTSGIVHLMQLSSIISHCGAHKSDPNLLETVLKWFSEPIVQGSCEILLKGHFYIESCVSFFRFFGGDGVFKISRVVGFWQIKAQEGAMALSFLTPMRWCGNGK